MAREFVCPHCGASVSIDGSPDPEAALALHRTAEIVIPATSSAGDLSTDAIDGAPPAEVDSGPVAPPGVLSDEAIPAGPIGELPAYGSSAEVSAFPLDSSSASTEVAAKALAEGSVSPADGPAFFGRSGPIPAAVAAEAAPTASSSHEFPALDLAAGAAASPPTPGGLSTRRGGDGPHDEPRGLSWALVLLGSYASAMTLAVAYLLWIAPRRAAPPETLVTDSRPDLGAPPRRRPVAAPIAPDHRTSIGRPLQVGDLEITPTRIEAGRVQLERLNPDAEGEEPDGGAGSLLLHLRLRNLSETETFAPLERAFVREPDRGLPDSYIELEGGGLLEIYPLAVESEMAIVGQSFEAIGPGESLVTLVASDKGTARLANEPMTWRLRLRTGPGETDVIGITFRPDEIP